MRLLQLDSLFGDDNDLRVNDGGKIYRAAARQSFNLCECETRSLQYQNLMDALQFSGTIIASPRGRTERLHQPACLVKAERAAGQPGTAGNLSYVECLRALRIIHGPVMPVDAESTSSPYFQLRR